MAVTGIDIGGTGIKGALVDVRRGRLTTERVRILTPRPATRDAVLATVVEVVAQVGGDGVVGVTFPGVITHGTVRTAPNLGKDWIGTDLPTLLSARIERPVIAVNDADAAGVAEVGHGVAKGRKGVVLMLTFGTGVGSALFLDGKLVPNTELGHVELDGVDAEKIVSEIARERRGLSWKKWAKHANAYLAELEGLFSPDLFVIGGGITKKPDAFLPLLKTRAPVTVAALGNEAGIVGAAMTAARPATPARLATKAPTDTASP